MSSEQTIEHKIDLLAARVATLADAQRKRDELFQELSPIARQMLAAASERLEAAEQAGYLAFGRGLADVVDHIVKGYSPEDVADLARSIVTILDTVRALTQPQMLKLASDLSDAAGHVDRLEPAGVVGMVRASRDLDAQRGMAVVLEVLRRLGRGVEELDRKERLRQQLASRRARTATEARRTGTEHPTAPRREAVTTPTAAKPAAQQAAPSQEPILVDGVAFTPEGFLVDASAWNKNLAESIAASVGVEMTDVHWKLIEFARQEFAETGASPNIRRLSKGSGIPTKELYAMFPKAPGKCAAMIAGLPKPVGCI